MILSFFIVYKKSMYLHCPVQRAPTTAMPSQVAHAANRKKQWYSLAKWQLCQHWLPPILKAQSATRWQSCLWPKSSQQSTLVPKVSLGGEEKQQWRHVPPTTDVWTCKASGTSLVQPIICVVLVTQEQMPNVTPNATINVVMPLNASKRQCHLMIMMTMIATIIVMCQHTHKTTAPFQLNRLQQATINWYWRSKSWSQTFVGQQDDRFIQQLPLLLEHMPKKWLPVQLCPQMHQMQCGRPSLWMPSCLKGRGSMSCSCRHCVPAHSYLMRSQIRIIDFPCNLFTFIVPKMAESVGSMTKIETPYQKWSLQQHVAMQKTILTGTKHEKYMWFASWLIS